MKRRRILPFGAELTDAGVRFRLWAPDADAVTLQLDDGRALPMLAEGEGWFRLTTQAAAAGTRYRYRIGGGAYADPASRAQPDGALGPSMVVDPTGHDWQDAGWQGVPWERAVLYELHPGAFTEAGDFAGIAGRLDHLAALGVTLIELMPVADCPGRWNWGYDGVLPFAPTQRYGGPEGLKRLVEACHARGIGVMLDVVYNHFGPEGNFLHVYAGAFFTRKHQTPWGAAINFDDLGAANVRQFFIENALYWLEEFHLDGLRFDAVHAFQDTSRPSFLEELGARIRREVTDRPIHLVLENDANEPALLGFRRGGKGAYDAQWNDDFHHALRVALVDAAGGYYEDYRDDPIGRLGRTLAEGFAYQGEPSGHRGGRLRGASTAGLPPTAFVNFAQNHDQVGNHAFGWRLPRFAGFEQLRAAAALLLLSPGVPMLFMGEEWASTAPFPYFCDFGGDLGQAVRNGRLAEFASFPEFRDEAARAEIPDPLAEVTFRSAQLDWAEPALPGHDAMLAHYRSLIALRRTHLVPLLACGLTLPGSVERFGRGGLAVRWRFGDARLALLANLSDGAAPAPEQPAGELLYRSDDTEGTLPPWFVSLTREAA